MGYLDDHEAISNTKDEKFIFFPIFQLSREAVYRLNM